MQHSICNQIKSISTVDLIYEVTGHRPKRITGGSAWYHSFLREGDSTPSLKVDMIKNIWSDYGLGVGGNNIDLLMHIWQTGDVKEIIRRFCSKQNLFSFDKQNSIISCKKNNIKQKIKIERVISIESPELIQYLGYRCIPLELASLYIREIYYTVNEVNFNALGFANNQGGWELRNSIYKGSISPKAMTVIPGDKNACCVFEGFMDFLSYLIIKKTTRLNSTALILNSTKMLKPNLKLLESFQKKFLFLDNDEEGLTTSDWMKSKFNDVVDCSHFYSSDKDINEFLINKMKGAKS
ncbi:MAG: toprim domain-containing protein [Cyclobacteriaceae bacterium]